MTVNAPICQNLEDFKEFQKTKLQVPSFWSQCQPGIMYVFINETATGPTKKPWINPPQLLRAHDPQSSTKWIAGSFQQWKIQTPKNRPIWKTKTKQPWFCGGFFSAWFPDQKKPTIFGFKFFSPEKWWVTYLKVKIDGTNTKKGRFVKGPCKAICRDG